MVSIKKSEKSIAFNGELHKHVTNKGSRERSNKNLETKIIIIIICKLANKNTSRQTEISRKKYCSKESKQGEKNQYWETSGEEINNCGGNTEANRAWKIIKGILMMIKAPQESAHWLC